MKKLIFFSVIISFALISGCCHKKELSKQKTPDNNKPTLNNNSSAFEAYYFHTTESSYEEVSIKNSRITYTYFKGVKVNFSNGWNQKELTKKDTILSKADIDSLKKHISKTGFMKLDTVIGNPASTDKYYTFMLMFNIDGKKRTVHFKSIPGGILMPDAFRKSRDALMMLVRKRTGVY
ncbi:MAG: hypothetical protein ABR968_06090 [Bacteroidales bacterium]|jgi:uncharacterized membrane protein